MIAILILVVGFILLVWGADKFVEGTSAFASKLGIPSLIIGLTIVAFGTSAPELAVSVSASFQGANEIAVGNVLGSNIFNLLAVVGCSACISPLLIEKDLLNRDWVGSIISVFVLGLLLCFDNNLSRLDGIILLIGFTLIIGLQIKSALKSKKQNIDIEVCVEPKKKLSIIRIAFYIIFGLIAIILGGQMSVNGATSIARMFNISETIIGLTIVAVGTSLPELVTSVVATKRGENSIAIGNVIGSNLFNVLFILGISAVCNPINTQFTALLDTLVLLIVSVVMFFFACKNNIGKKTGVCMVLGYILYTVWIILR